MTKQSGDVPFARVTLKGDRFTGGRLPIDALHELSRYQRMVLEAAASAWADNNPEIPLPEDFEESLQLVVADIEDGSAASVLERRAGSAYDGYFETGRDSVQERLTHVSAPFGQQDSVYSSTAFRDFGSSLSGPDELVVEIAPPTAGSPTPSPDAHITADVWRQDTLAQYRRQLRLGNTRYTELGTVAGRLTALDANKRSFLLRTLKHGRVTGRYSDGALTDDLRAVLNSSEVAPVIRVTGLLRYNGEGRLVRVLNISQLDLLTIEGDPWSRRIIELASLDDGWLDGTDGKAPSFDDLEAVKVLCSRIRALGHQIPGIFPLEEGGVLLEWSSPRRVASIETTDGGYLLFSKTSGERADQIETEDLSEVTDWMRVALP